MSQEKEIIESSGNVFADLDLPMPEEIQAKAALVYQINQIIETRKLSQRQAGKMFGLSQPKMSALASGQLSEFSYEHLIQCLNILDCDIRIEVIQKSGHIHPARVTVVASEIGI
ncbi:helix-turn-helix transcriptional regulator [Desulfococcaceae bacterium HSG7]|nr:helix-turn-helix transcriptional regulator [Desulfococcaceae bacterium HSG7]